jgi:flagellar M-ring protein FliF
MNLSLLTSLSPKGKGILAACAVGFIAAAIMLVKMAGSTSYTQIMAGVDPAQTGKITAALSQAGVAYKLENNGTAVAVDASQTGPANIALASAGLTGMSKQPGFELLDKQKLGASNFQQQVAYQRALEGQIANTIGQIAGVGSAQVSLTLPKDQLFTDEAQSATAAVLLGGSGDAIDPGAVRGIANLVSSSVQGLKTANVTITDAGGQMLWPLADAAGAGATSKPAAEARYNAQLQASLNAMLVSTLGPGKARVQVNSDLNVDKASQEKLQYAKTGTPLTATDDTETLAGNGATSGGAAGTATNIPSYAQTVGGGTGKSNYKHVTKTTTFGVDKTITRTQIAPGAVNRLNVALVLDKAAAAKLGPAGVKSLQAAVASAAGIVPSRGDSLAVSQVAFAPVTTPAAPKSALPIPASMLAYAKTALLGLAALLFLFFVSRGLRKRQSGAFTEEPAWLRQLSQPAPPMLSAGDFQEEDRLELDRFDAQEAAKKIFANDPRAIALEEIVEKEPDKIAQHLRTWITEDN